MQTNDAGDPATSGTRRSSVMKIMSRFYRSGRALFALSAALLVAGAAQAQDKVRVGVFPVSSTLPLFVGIERGFFKEVNIDVETTRLIGGPPNVAALIGNQIDAAAVLVTIEGMNANLKKPGVAMYISLNSQNAKYQMEQFVVRKGLEIKSLADLKGKKIMSAPGPANVSMARRRWPPPA
jgi:NitT/TauT family transport system substrate-binding protein